METTSRRVNVQAAQLRHAVGHIGVDTVDRMDATQQGMPCPTARNAPQNGRRGRTAEQRRRDVEEKLHSIVSNCNEVVVENHFTHKMVGARAETYVKGVVSRLKRDVASPPIPDGRMGIIVLLLPPACSL